MFRAPGIRVVTYHGTSKRDRVRALSKVHRRGGVVLTSYGMVISNIDTLSEKDCREFVWVSLQTDWLPFNITVNMHIILMQRIFTLESCYCCFIKLSAVCKVM